MQSMASMSDTYGDIRWFSSYWEICSSSDAKWSDGKGRARELALLQLPEANMHVFRRSKGDGIPARAFLSQKAPIQTFWHWSANKRVSMARTLSPSPPRLSLHAVFPWRPLPLWGAARSWCEQLPFGFQVICVFVLSLPSSAQGSPSIDTTPSASTQSRFWGEGIAIARNSLIDQLCHRSVRVGGIQKSVVRVVHTDGQGQKIVGARRPTIQTPRQDDLLQELPWYPKPLGAQISHVLILKSLCSSLWAFFFLIGGDFWICLSSTSDRSIFSTVVGGYGNMAFAAKTEENPEIDTN